MIAGGEWGDALFHPGRWLESIRYLWHDTEGTGKAVPPYFVLIPFYYLATFLERVGLSMVAFQAILFWLLLSTGAVSVYFLVWHLTAEEKRPLAGILAALFYVLNPFAQALVWHRFLYTSMFLYASLPLLLLLFVLGLKKRRIVYALLISVVSFAFASAYGTPGYAVLPWLTVGTYLIIYLVSNRRDRKKMVFALQFGALSMVLWVVTNAWWILPFVKTAPAFFYDFTSVSGSLSSLKAVSQYFSLYYLVRLLNSYHFFLVHSWGQVYKTLPFQIISWLIPLFVLFGLLASVRSLNAWYFALLGGIGLFFGKGTSPPLGSFYASAMKSIPFFSVFRGPEKIGIIIPLAYAFLFGVGLCSLFYLIRRWSRFVALTVLIVVAFAILVVYPWPMWTGQVWPGKYASTEVEIPAHYREADRWLSRQQGTFRTMHLPFISGDGVIYQWKHGYNGSEPSHVLFPNGPMSRLQQVRFVDDILRQVPERVHTNQIWKVMALLNCDYILLHYDLDFKAMNMDSPRVLESALRRIRKTTGFKSVMSHDTKGKPEDKPAEWSLWAPPGSTISWDMKDMFDGQATVKVEANLDRGKTFGALLNLPPPGKDYPSETMVRVSVKSNVPAKLLVSLLDEEGGGISWDGRQDGEYSIAADETGYWKPFFLDVGRATSSSRYPARVRKILVALVEAKPNREGRLSIGDVSLGRGRMDQVQGISKIRRFGELSLYQLDENLRLPRVYAVSKIALSKDANSMLVDVDDPSFLPSETAVFLRSQARVNEGIRAIKLKKDTKPKVSFRKINAAHYRVQIRGAGAPFLLILAETYSPDWEASIEETKVRQHFIVNGYANAYYVDRKGSFAVDIEYAPTRLLRAGAVLSGGSLLAAVLGFISFPLLKRRFWG